MDAITVGDAKIYQGDCLEVLKTLPDESVQCCVTSPPYFGLRDYGHAEQIGLEETPEQYIAKLVQVFREVRRVLRADGTLWLNIGDSYANGGRKTRDTDDKLAERGMDTRPADPDGIKPKDLIGIPWMLAFALRADGWWLRQDIIWAKKNPMPESVKDRCTKAHEYLFLLSKSERYFFDSDAMREPSTGVDRGDRSKHRHKHVESVTARVASGDHRERTKLGLAKIAHAETRNRRSVWTVATKPYNGKKALTDYVGDDGKPYTASPDCPIHGHLARRQTSGTRGYGGQQDLTRTGNADTDSNLAPLPVCDEQSMTSHNSLASAECNSQWHTLENMRESKTDFHQTARTSGEESQLCSVCKSESGEHQDCGTDCSLRVCSLTAICHSTEMSKTAPSPVTNQPCTPCAETGSHTQSTSDQHGLFEQDRGISESSILTVATSVHPSQNTRSCNAGTSFELASMACDVGEKCICNEAIIDHFATFPPALIEPCILAGCPEEGTVLDPFNGSGTTGAVALQHGRRYIGIELNPEYINLAVDRIGAAIPRQMVMGF